MIKPGEQVAVKLGGVDRMHGAIQRYAQAYFEKNGEVPPKFLLYEWAESACTDCLTLSATAPEEVEDEVQAEA